MQILAWVFIAVLALLLMFFWMGFEKRIPITATTAAFLWAFWGWQATSVTYGTDVVLQESYPALRMFGIFMAVVNAMLLALWLWTDEDNDLFSQI